MIISLKKSTRTFLEIFGISENVRVDFFKSFPEIILRISRQFAEYSSFYLQNQRK